MIRRRLFDSVNYCILVLLSLSILFPFLIIINQSLMTTDEIMRNGYTLFPEKIVLDAYKYLLFDNYYIYRGFSVSLFVSVTGTLLCLLFTCSFAYGLSKKFLPYRNAITLFVLVTMFFSGGLIPSYMLISGIGLKNSLWALMLPTLILAWNLFLMRNFFMELPGEVEESAAIDGASTFKIFYRIVVPMSMPAMVTIGLFYMVFLWNSWFSAAIYITDQEKWPLQLILKEMITSLDMKALSGGGSREMLGANMPQESVKAAAIIITSLPIISVYPFIQKYFVKGMLVGSVKG